MEKDTTTGFTHRDVLSLYLFIKRDVMRKCICILAVLLFSIGICALSWADINDGLVAFYPFNGNALDESGNGNDGAVYGATLTEDRFGSADSAYSFDGVNDKIVTTKKNFANNNTFSISLWFKYDYFNGVRYFIVCSDFGIWTYGWETGVAVSLPLTESAYGKLHSGGWHHFVGTYDGTYIKAYIDGAFVDETLHAGNISDADRGLTFGYFLEYWKGSLDEVRIYNRVLSDSEIQKLYRVQFV